jgi:hypothetical protein
MRIAWPSFVAACMLEMLVFAAVDPLDIHWSANTPGWSRQGVYSAAFFSFWGICALSSAVTAFLARPSKGDML